MKGYHGDEGLLFLSLNKVSSSSTKISPITARGLVPYPGGVRDYGVFPFFTGTHATRFSLGTTLLPVNVCLARLDSAEGEPDPREDVI